MLLSSPRVKLAHLRVPFLLPLVTSRLTYGPIIFRAFLADTIKSNHHSRANSWGQRLISALDHQGSSLAESKSSLFPDERVWYDQFTSTDWVHDSIADAYRAKALRSRKDFWGRVYLLFDGAQGWILSALVGFLVAVIAYVVNVTESTAFDFKDGYCTRGWYINEKVCMVVREEPPLGCRYYYFSCSLSSSLTFVT